MHTIIWLVVMGLYGYIAWSVVSWGYEELGNLAAAVLAFFFLAPLIKGMKEEEAKQRNNR